MLIAFLIMLGIDLVVIVLLVAAIVARKRWVRSQPGVIGVTAGSCRIEVAAAGAERDRLLGPYRTPASSRPPDRTRDPGS